jgi:hypothetical protein
MSGDGPFKLAVAKIAQYRIEIAKLEDFIAMYHTLSGEESVASKEVGDGPDVQEEPRNGRPIFSSTAEILEASAAILTTKGSAMLAAEIYEKLVADGVRIGGRKPKGNLTAKFSLRKDLFKHDAISGKWSLTSWKVPTWSPGPSAQHSTETRN